MIPDRLKWNEDIELQSCIRPVEDLLRDEDIELEGALPDEVSIKISVCINLHLKFSKIAFYCKEC